MADQKISDLAALTGANVATDDFTVVVDKSDTTMAATGTDKQITADELRKALARLGIVSADSIWDAAGDVLIGTGADTGARLAIGSAAGAALVADPNATNKASVQYPHAVESATRGISGSLASTYDRASIAEASAGTILSTGRLALGRILLPKGLSVTNITFWSGSTALSAGSNQWFALFDSSRVKLAITGDDTSTAWAANTGKTLAVTGGAFVTTYTGWHYLGIMVKATTVPSLVSPASLNAANIRAAAPIPCGSADTGLTNPASCPSTAASLNAIGNLFYAEVS